MDLPSILITDDNEDDVFFLTSQLKSGRILNPLKIFRDGETLIQHLALRGQSVGGNSEPVLLLLDLKMPKKTGFDVLEWMKHENVNLPVIVLSAVGEVHQMSRVFQLGARGFLLKPMTGARFLNAIHKISELEILDEPTGLQLKRRALSEIEKPSSLRAA